MSHLVKSMTIIQYVGAVTAIYLLIAVGNAVFRITDLIIIQVIWLCLLAMPLNQRLAAWMGVTSLVTPTHPNCDRPTNCKQLASTSTKR